MTNTFEKFRRFTRNVAILPMVLVLLLTAQVTSANEIEFSAPTTAPEKALHAILQWHHHETGQRSTVLFDFLTQRSGRSKASDMRYQRKFTMSLVRAISAADQRMHDKDCEGICGLDFDPILCAQDILLPPHAYLTTSKARANGWPAKLASSDSHAYILYRRGRVGESYLHRVDYLMEKEGGAWKIAGVYCRAEKPEFENKFNVP